jgi:uncharacterized protein YndB with AHSA1/START domain
MMPGSVEQPPGNEGRKIMPTQAHRINIGADPQSVFEALSTAEGWRSWFTSEVKGEFTDGSEVVCHPEGRATIRLRVTSVQPGSAITFEALEGPFAAPGATTSILLQNADDGRTTVDLLHDTPRIPDADLAACNTYWGMLLGQLREYCQTHHAATLL